MDASASTLNLVALHGHGSDQGLDYYVAAELRSAMARIGIERALRGEGEAVFSLAELADMVPLSADQLRRRFRGESGFTMDDLQCLSEALGVEAYTLLQAATMRMRLDRGAPEYDPPLRGQVLEGPGGFPIIH